jgi:hypothetical protein
MFKKLLVSVLFIIFLSSCAHSNPLAGHDMVEGELKGADQLVKTYGIVIVSLQPTAAGQLLDLRYKVVNPALAKAFFKSTPGVEFRLSKVKEPHELAVPETDLGKLKNKAVKPKMNQIFYVLFENPGARIKKGDQVTLIVGKIELDTIIVE